MSLASFVELILKTLLVQEGLSADPTVLRPSDAPRGIELDKLFGRLPGDTGTHSSNCGRPRFDARSAEYGEDVYPLALIVRSGRGHQHGRRVPDVDLGRGALCVLPD